MTALRKGDRSEHVRTAKLGTTAGGFLTELDEHIAAEVKKAKSEVLDEFRALSLRWGQMNSIGFSYAQSVTDKADQIARKEGIES